MHCASENCKPTLLEAVWEMIRHELQARQRQVIEEIRQYPPPIPACDAQFNYLLEQRDEIARELDRLHETTARGVSSTDALALIGKFIASSSYLDQEAKLRVAAALAARPSYSLGNG